MFSRTVKLLLVIFLIENIGFVVLDGDRECSVLKQNNGRRQFKHFFPLNSGKSPKEGNVHLNFSVIAHSALICLTETPNPDGNCKYEIKLHVLCAIKRNRLIVGAIIGDKNPLSPIEATFISLDILKTGSIEVRTEERLLLKYTDPNPIHVRYFSFAVDDDYAGIFFFSCSENYEIEKTETEHRMSYEDTLKQQFSDELNSLSGVLDSDETSLMNFDVTFEILRLELNVDDSKFSLYGVTTLDWTNINMIWDPDEKDDLTSVTLEDQIAWEPDILLFNSFDWARNYVIKEGVITVYHNGLLSWISSLELHATCDISFENWPWDIHICKLKLGSLSNISTTFKLQFYNMESDWLLEQCSRTHKLPQLMKTESDFERPFDAVVTEISMVLRRKTSFYHNWFYYMLLVICLMLFLAICVSPFGIMKITLNSFCIFTLTVMLFITVNSLPEITNEIPLIVVTYYILLVTSSVYGVVAVLLITLSRMEHSSLPSDVILSIINKLIIFKLFLKLQGTVNDDSGNMDRNDKKHERKRNLEVCWLKVVSAIDLIILIFTVSLIAYLLIINFPPSLDNSSSFVIYCD